MERRNHHRALIALKLIPGLGPQRIKKLLEATKNGYAADVFKKGRSELQKIEGIGDRTAQTILTFREWEAVDQVLERTRAAGAELVALNDPDYPELLRHIYDPPSLLWVKGDKRVLNHPGIAVIGTRNPGRYGLQQAEKWSKQFCETGLSVISGLAYGIDSAAHRETVKRGGKTVAVLGSGIDRIYPLRNTSLAASIVECNGAVITEYMPGTKPDPAHFPQRNRIVSGMSHGVLVVESGLKGGSMITARCALDQNREVFVVPHQADNARGAGGNYLIKTGQGKLVQNMEDVTEEISVNLTQADPVVANQQGKTVWRQLELNPDASRICKLLEKGELHIDVLSDQTGTEIHKLMAELLELEMEGAVTQRAGKYFGLR